jgi:hypothetical protein
MNYKEKYEKYKNKYNDIKKIQIIKNLVGGCKIPHLNIHDIESILNYIRQHIHCAPSNTRNKYFVICYGPPASGKSIARKIACNLIKNIYMDGEDISTILSSFIDTGIDDIIASTITRNSIPLKDLLKQNIKHLISGDIEGLRDEELHRKLEPHKILLESNQEIYFNVKKQVDEMSLLLGVFASLLGKNVFFEISRPNITYIKNLIDTVYQWKYKILFIYPYTTNYELLCYRSNRRGLTEGRIVPCEQIKKDIIDCKKEYDTKVKNDLLTNYKDICILHYNAELTPLDLANINNGNFKIDQNKQFYDFFKKDNGNFTKITYV